MKRIIRCLVLVGVFCTTQALAPPKAYGEGCWYCWWQEGGGQCTLCMDQAWHGAYGCQETCQGGCWLFMPGQCNWAYHHLDVNPAGTVLVALGMRPASTSEDGGLVRNCRGHILSRAYPTAEVDRKDTSLKRIVL